MEEHPKEPSVPFGGGQLSEEAAEILTRRIVAGHKLSRVMFHVFSLLPLLLSAFFAWVFISEVDLDSFAGLMLATIAIGGPALFSAFLWSRARRF